MTPHLTQIKVAGFRSLRDVTVDLTTPVTVLIGANGAGKSNLLTVLRMIPLMLTQSLRRFVGSNGGASALLHYGPSVTTELALSLSFESDGVRSGYSARLGYAAGDAFTFLEEAASSAARPDGSISVVSLGSGHAESPLFERARDPLAAVEHTVDAIIGGMGFYHFHDSSPMSPLRQSAVQADNLYLRAGGSNLAAVLYRLRESEVVSTRASWNLIRGLVRRVAPFIKELNPALVDPDRPQESVVQLHWTDERDHKFGVHDLSDGTLRAIALITALAQPTSSLPKFITIDEPELGLHPAAINVLASLVRSVSTRCQVLLSTQSPALLDQFDPEEVIVTERRAGETSFGRLSKEKLAGWLDDYSLSELYDKNVLGGRP